MQQAARSEQLRAHIRESGAIEALDFVLRQGYHMALLRYAAEDEDYYLRYCQRHGLRQEPIMEFPTCCSPVRTARWRGGRCRTLTS